MAEEKKLNLTPEQKLTIAVEDIKKIFTKYNVGSFNLDNLKTFILDLHNKGEDWYRDYCILSEEADKDVDYSGSYNRAMNQEKISDGEMIKLETNELFIRIMAQAKLLEAKLNKPNASNVKDLLELSSQLSQCEAEKENILQSYLDAGISPIIIEHFVKNQNQNYADLLKKSRGLELRIELLEKEQTETIEDGKTLKKAIETIETETKLKYEDPDSSLFSSSTDGYSYRYDYNQALRAEMQKSQTSNPAQRKRK